MKALEVKVATLIEERNAAKQNVRDAIHAMKAALEELRLKVKDTLLALFAEDSSRHTGLAEVCNHWNVQYLDASLTVVMPTMVISAGNAGISSWMCVFRGYQS